MNHIKEIIIDYIKKDKINYAIMLTGEWGSGKTYFIKKILKEEIEKTKVNKSDKDTYKILYVSLYGLTDFDEVHKRIFLEIYPSLNIKNKKMKLITSFSSRLMQAGAEFAHVSSLFKSKMDYKQLYNLDKYILCFDDLERISSDLNVEDVLGFINTFVEHDSVRTIIVTNETEIKENEKYLKIKEKLIGRSIEFVNNNIEDLYDDLIRHYKIGSKDYFEFLKVRKSLILKLFDKSGKFNLRSLIFAIDSYLNIFEGITTMVSQGKLKKNDNFEKFQISMLTLALGLFFEYKKGIKLVREFLNEFIVYSDYSYRFEVDENTDNNIKILKPRYLYKNYYLDLNIRYEFSKTIFEFAISGYFNKDNFIKETVDNLQEFPEYVTNRNKIDSFYFLEDDEFQATLDKVLNSIQAGEYQLSEYIPLYVRISWFIEISIYSKINIAELKDKIIMGIRSKKEIDKELSEIEIDLKETLKRGDANIESIMDEIRKVGALISDSKNKDLSYKLNQLLKDEFERFVNMLNSEYVNTPVLKAVGAKDLFDNLLKQSNIHIYLFYLGVSKRYKQYNFPYILKEEINNLRELKLLIDEYLKQKPSTIKTTHLSKISGEIATLKTI